MSDIKIGKADLVNALAEETGIPKTKCSELLTSLVNQIQTNVAAGHTVTIPGFGTFLPRARLARQGRNPRSGETVEIAASVVPAFKVGAQFKAQVSGK